MYLKSKPKLSRIKKKKKETIIEYFKWYMLVLKF